MGNLLRKLRAITPEYLALGASLAWALVCALYFLRSSGGHPVGMAAFVFVLVPLALVWGWAYFARRCAVLEEQITQLHVAFYGAPEAAHPEDYAAYDDAYQDADDAPYADAVADIEPQVSASPEFADMPETTMRAEPDLSTPSFAADPVAPEPSPAISEVATAPEPVAAPEMPEQHSLDLGGAPHNNDYELSHKELIRALNFPDDANDHEGVAALRRALDDHKLAQLIQAAQDVLTLLSQNSVFMEDVVPAYETLALWRRFAAGERDAQIVQLGALQDEALLTVVAQRMKSDTIFRDAAHHFLRRFDKLLCKIEPDLSDQDMIALSETRSARAFICIGRVAGAFDG